MKWPTRITADGEQPVLEPPATPDEERWWAMARRRFYRTMLLRMALPFFLVFTVSTALARPEKLLRNLPFLALMAVAAGLLTGKMAERAQRLQEIRHKRIRESILADPPDEKP